VFVRSDSAASDHFDLLPFIAILLCALGCLLLVTISVAAISLGIGSNEVWIPVGGGAASKTKKTALLCEWDGSTATFHENRARLSLTWKPPKTQEITLGGQTFVIPDEHQSDPNPELNRKIEAIKARKDSLYVLFAVRPSGFATFNRFSSEFRRADITIGYEPLGQSRPLELRADSPSTSQPSGR
jgi:hypothetical protein